ncbi:MAG: UbiA family prenyltransferase [Luteolibacter sp.]
MKPNPGTWRALAATARLANLPSVVSNVALGLILGHAQTMPAACALISGGALYLSGGFLNDWADRNWDAQHRPERALPTGLLAPRLYLALAVAFAGIGLMAAALVNPGALAFAVVISASVAIYTWLHKQTAVAVLPMALCRALLPLLGLAATGAREMWPYAACAAAGLFAHVAGISWLARGESRPVHGPCTRHASWLFAGCGLVVMGGAVSGLEPPAPVFLAALLPYALWTGHAVMRRGMNTGARVSALLAGIPLVDWMLLLPFYFAVQTSSAALWLPPLAFACGRLAQRLTPAT